MTTNYTYRNQVWLPTIRQIYQYTEVNSLRLLQSEALIEGHWRPRYRFQYGAYIHGKKGYDSYEVWSEDQIWEKQYRSTYTYNQAGKILEQTLYVGEKQNTWEPDKRFTYLYHADTLVLDGLTESWLAGGWEIQEHVQYSYNDNARITQIQTDQWDQQSSLQEYRYPSSSISIRTFSIAIGTTWVPQQQDSTIRNSDGHVIRRTSMAYDTTCQCYLPRQQSHFTWSEDLLIHYQVLREENGVLMPNIRSQYTYNEAGCRKEEQTLAGQKGAWVPQYQTIATYTTDCQPAISDQYLFVGTTFEHRSRTHYYYGQDEDAPFSSFPAISVAPNPVEDQCTIYLTDDALYGAVAYQLMDLQGRVCLDGRCEGPSHQLATTSLMSGTYVLRLSYGGKTEIRKLILR